MEIEIPLIKDLNKTYPNFDINSYFDVKIIEMLNNFNNNKFEQYTNEEIYNYIKFVNVTCLDSIYYKYIIKYITKNNFDYFVELFDNYDIFNELFHLLSFEAVSCHPNFAYLKKFWFIKNIEKSSRYFNEFKDFLSYNGIMSSYYIIDDKLYFSNNNNNIFINDLRSIYYDARDLIFDKIKDKSKFILKTENIYLLITQLHAIIDNISYSLNNTLIINIKLSIMICNLDLIKYFAEKAKNTNVDVKNLYVDEYIENPIILNKIDIIDYIFNNFKINFNETILLAIKHNKNENLSNINELIIPEK